MRSQFIVMAGLDRPRCTPHHNVELNTYKSTNYNIDDIVTSEQPSALSTNHKHQERPSSPPDNYNSHYKFFAEAGARGGKKSRDHCKFRRTAIAQLVQQVLYGYPLDIPLKATFVANEIHDKFASIVRNEPARYGSLENFGAQDMTVSKPLLDFLIKTIRILVRGGLKLVKSSAKEWYPAPGCVPA